MPHKQVVKMQCNLAHNGLLYTKDKEPKSVQGRLVPWEFYGRDAIRSKSGKMFGCFPGGERAVRIYVPGRGEYFVEIMDS